MWLATLQKPVHHPRRLKEGDGGLEARVRKVFKPVMRCLPHDVSENGKARPPRSMSSAKLTTSSGSAGVAERDALCAVTIKANSDTIKPQSCLTHLLPGLSQQIE